MKLSRPLRSRSGRDLRSSRGPQKDPARTWEYTRTGVREDRSSACEGTGARTSRKNLKEKIMRRGSGTTAGPFLASFRRANRKKKEKDGEKCIDVEKIGGGGRNDRAGGEESGPKKRRTGS